MSKKKANNKQAKELNPLVAIGVIGVVVAGGAYFLLDSDSDDNYSSQLMTQTPTTTIIEKVEAPDAINAPMILPAQVRNLDVFNNSITFKQHDVQDAKLDAEIARSKLVVAQLKKQNLELKSQYHGMKTDDYGLSSNSRPLSNFYDGKNAIKTAKVSKVTTRKNFNVSMVSSINGHKAALVNDKRVVVGDYVHGERVVSISIKSNRTCFKAKGKRSHCENAV